MTVDALRVSQERIRRFHLLGGVDLSHHEVDDPLRIEVEVGTAEHRHATFRFRCEMCGKVESSPQEMEPLCTGPSWTDDHPPTVMEKIKT